MKTIGIIVVWSTIFGAGVASGVTHKCVAEKHCQPSGSAFRPTFVLKDNFGNQGKFEGQDLHPLEQCATLLETAVGKLSPCHSAWHRTAAKENRRRESIGRNLERQVRVITVSPRTLDRAGARYDGKRIYGFRESWTQFFRKIQLARPRAVFLDYRFARTGSERDDEEKALLEVLREIKDQFPLFACTPWGKTGDTLVSRQFRWGSCAVDRIVLAENKPSRAARYCAHGPRRDFQKATPFLLSGKEFLKTTESCAVENRPVMINLLESLGFPVPQELFHRTQVTRGDQVYRALAIPRKVTEPHWDMGTVLSSGFSPALLRNKILLVGDEIPGNDEHTLEGRFAFGIYNHVNTLKALLTSQTYAAAPKIAKPATLASQPSQSRLDP